MNSTLILILTGVTAYLVGAIPFGYLVGRMRGVDIRTVGSRNIGATNVFRSIGKLWGIATFILDLGKGWCGATVMPALMVQLMGAEGAVPAAELRLAGGVCAVVGHTWPVYLRFKGGKGVATSAGMLIGLAPQAVGIALAGWIVTFVAGRYVSLASIAAAVVLGVAIWFEPFRPDAGWVLPAVLTLLALLIIVRHRANIQRLRAGTESRFSFTRGRKPEGRARP